MAAKKSTNSTKPAKSDTFVDLVNEDHRIADLGVLVNDHGPATLYSLSQNPPSIIPGTPLPVVDNVQLPSGAVISMNADGTVHYDSSNWTSAFLSRLQGMHAGQRIVDFFTYTIRTENGEFSTARVTLLLEGKNDAATITGTSAGELTEDASLSATGTLVVNDVDTGDKKFQTPASLDGTYGTFSFDAASGLWGYALSNGAANVQALNADQTVIDSLTVTSKDGSASKTIFVNIHGADEVVIDPDPPVNAVIGGTANGAVTEDGTLTVNAALSITDPNAGEAGFQAPGSVHGTYGDFTFAPATGIWGYALRNGDANVQVLTQGEHHNDTLVVHSLDGTATQTISVTVNGANELPTLAPLNAITIADTSADDDPAPVSGTALGHDANVGTTLHYTASVAPVVVTNFLFAFGSPPEPLSWGDLSIDGTTGAYTFTADAAAIDMLMAGEQVALGYTLAVSNGITVDATQVLTITLTGSTDAAVITGSDTGSVTEDDTLVTSGKLDTSQRDHDVGLFDTGVMSINEAYSTFSFSDPAHPLVGTVDGHYGKFSFDAGSGDWQYALDNTAAQALGAGDHPTESLLVFAAGDTATHTITVTVFGADEPAAPVDPHPAIGTADHLILVGHETGVIGTTFTQAA